MLQFVLILILDKNSVERKYYEYGDQTQFESLFAAIDEFRSLLNNGLSRQDGLFGGSGVSKFYPFGSTTSLTLFSSLFRH